MNIKKTELFLLLMGLALAGCGGGSSGSDDSAPASLSNTNLSGTWVQTNVNYAKLNSQADYEWVKTRNQTIIIEEANGAVRLTDCMTGTGADASKSGNSLVFALPQIPQLQFVDANTLQTEVSCTSCMPPSRTKVQLQRASSDTTTALAAVSIVDPVAVTQWDQVCVESIVDGYLQNSVKIRATESNENVTLTASFTAATPFEAGVYTYPAATASVSATLVTEMGSLGLSNPTGTLVVSENATTDFTTDLIMQSGLDGSDVSVQGEIEFNPRWFVAE